MHAAIATTTTACASRGARRLASSTILKRPVNARPRKTPAFLQTKSSGNSTLALETLARRRGNSDRLQWSQIRAVFLSAAVPMVGFGFMDNFVMIQAGSYIDSTIGVQFGLATLTAAAMGQVVSDVSGVLFGGTLERMLSPWVKPANLTAAQQRLALVPRIRLAGAAIGVIVGCTLGATSLFFVLDSNSQLEEEQLRQLGGVVHDMLAGDVLKDAACSMHIANIPHSFDVENVSVMALSKENDPVSRCRNDSQVVVGDNSIYVPVSTDGGDVLAVLELKQDCGFSHDDTEEAKRVARHVGIFMKRMLME